MARQFFCSQTGPVVQTRQGKLRGFQVDGTYTFYGIPYAEAGRFQMPREPEPWEGIRDALSYGFVCPLLQQDTPNGEIIVPHRYWPMDEHCQNLNVWTQTLEPDARKPVMVWLHGGGFSAGSSIEQTAYDGENMSRCGDVVVVSVNHRLNILGYLDLAPFGEKYRHSANAGNADLVAALRWVHENIAAFGGDPENVTIFGQSGGGMKVWTLMQTPAADGLFHKGIIQSGVIDEFVGNEPTDSRPIVLALLHELGLDETEVEQLETVPYHRLAEAYNKVAPALKEAGEYVGCVPVPDDFYLGDPRVIGFTEHAKTIPVMIGTVFGEFTFGCAFEDKYAAPMAEKRALLEKKYGADTEALLRLFAEAYPEKDPSDLLCLDSLFRAPTRDFVLKKAACPQAPTYSYLFSYEFPYNGGCVAWHCAEIPFVFHNTCLVPVCNLPGVSDRLEEQIFGAWISFARYGNPNIPALPQWAPSTPEDEAVMIFDRVCKVKHNFDAQLIALHQKAAPAFDPDHPEEPIQH